MPKTIALALVVLLTGCEVPESVQQQLEQIGQVQSAVATDFDIDSDRINVSTFSGTGGTEMRVAFQNAELNVSDEALCQRVAEIVSATYAGPPMDRIVVSEASRAGVGPVGATSQRGICVVERNAPAPPAMDSTVTTAS